LKIKTTLKEIETVTFRRLILSATVTLASLMPLQAHAAPVVGQEAPGFTLNDINGKAHRLSDYLGSIVVLEWNNPQCPYVRKHYGSQTMQKLQRDMVRDKVVWLRIDSSAKGMEGYLEPAAAKVLAASDGSAQTAFLLDPEGTVGKAYGATTTPDMYVIDGKGVLQYMGAIDNAPSADPSTLVNAKSYVREAVAQVKAGQAVQQPVTQPYGCGIKYAPEKAAP
jgi:hypothetical protein